MSIIGQLLPNVKTNVDLNNRLSQSSTFLDEKIFIEHLKDPNIDHSKFQVSNSCEKKIEPSNKYSINDLVSLDKTLVENKILKILNKNNEHSLKDNQQVKFV